MRFGVCAAPEQGGLVAQAGYDYLEASVAGDLIPEEDEAAWAEKRRRLLALPLRAEAFNSFVRTGKIVGPEADPVRLRRYADTALLRAAQVGGEVIVLGSGGARQIPDGFPEEQADHQLREFLGFCADASERTGVVVVIEPLARSECNFVNRVSEGAAWARSVGRAGVRVLADTYHMEQGGEPVSEIVEAGDVLAHAHTADTGRKVPGTGVYDHAAFFRALNGAGYGGRVSLECSWGDFAAEVGPALAHLRRAVVRD